MHLRYDGIEHVFVPDSRLRRTGKLTVNMSDDDRKVWIGPLQSDPFAMFGLCTTKGGRAEAGWFEIGIIAEDVVNLDASGLTQGRKDDMSGTMIRYPDGQQLEPWFKVWFDEKFCQDIAVWGQCAVLTECSAYGHPMTPDAVGQWTLHFDHVDPLTDKSQWKFAIAEMLPGMRLKYTDCATGKSWVWVLTDQVQDSRGVRLGLWPD